MKKLNINGKLFISSMLVIFLMLLSNSTFGQIKVIQFNAGWNSANDIPWVMELADCKTISYIDVAKNTEYQK